MLAAAGLCALLLAAPQQAEPAETTPRPRARDLDIVIGALPPGPRNAITDVAGVAVGHHTLIEGDRIRTGVTVVVPHDGNLFRDKVPAGIAVANGFGKLVGFTQVRELGELESPIALTNTLNVGLVADALVGFMLDRPGNERVRSVNVVVGETNDGRLNDIRGRHVHAEHVVTALAAANNAEVAEGSVGAGTGTTCLGWKGGIGTASRVAGRHTVGVLVQTNFGGRLRLDGRPVHQALAAPNRRPGGAPREGSCMIVVAVDAALGSRNLTRLARRSFAGMARTGASFSNGSGDYAIAFSTAESMRIRHGATKTGAAVVSNAAMTPLLVAVADATEEAILNSLLQATPVQSVFGAAAALPIDALRAVLRKPR